LAALLRAIGQEVFEANGGAAAIDWLEKTPADLALTDLGMPQVAGWDVTRTRRQFTCQGANGLAKRLTVI
jgi:CheY-like chemotaxis protein